MLSQRLANVAFAILVLAGCVYFAVAAESFEAAGLLASSGLPSKFFPQLLLGFIAVCAAGVLAAYAARGSAGGDEGQLVYEKPIHALRGLLTLASLIAGFFIWQALGYVQMAAFLAAATCLSMGARNPAVYLAVCLLFAAIYLVFTQFLGTQF